jgi:cytochrome c peroxidase
MQKKTLIASVLFISMLLAACFSVGKKDSAQQVVSLYQQDVLSLNKEVSTLVRLIETNARSQALQEQFKKSRDTYKKIEWLAEYYHPYTVKYINGPALEEVELDEKNIVIQPEGFQVLEELLFPLYDVGQKEEVLHQAKVLQSNTGRLQQVTFNLQTTDAHIFDALRLEVFRILTLGISGFDSPVAQNSIPEAASSLKGVQKYYAIYENQLKNSNKALAERLHLLFQKTLEYISRNNKFDPFDRMTFITSYLNPLSEHLLLAQQQLNFPMFKEPRALKADAGTLFAANVFHPDFFTSSTEAYSNGQKIGLGRRLFFDGILSGDGKRSCASCHNPSKAFTDGLPKSRALQGGFVQRNAPTLLYAALQHNQFYDMRSAFLEDQAKEVVENKVELHGSLSVAAKKLTNDSSYLLLFQQAFSKQLDSVQSYHIQNALAAYIRSLIPFRSKFDRHMRGEKAMNHEEIEGFNLFMGKAKCGTCHFTPLFNGTVPPSFTATESEVIGVPEDKQFTRVDTDKGRYHIHQIKKFLHAFKTPTLRNVQLTGPYMHNGVFQTLDEVIDFYDQGGAVGRNLQLDNQTLPADKLSLTKDEKRKLVLFLNTLTDDIKYQE